METDSPYFVRSVRVNLVEAPRLMYLRLARLRWIGRRMLHWANWPPTVCSQVRMDSVDVEGCVGGGQGPNGGRWWGGRIGANRWGIENRDPQRSLEGYLDCYRNPALVYTAAKAFFSLWKTS